MNVKNILKGITQELNACFDLLDEAPIDALEDSIRSAEKVYVAGAGRSLMMIRGLAMRLMHMGFRSYVVGETITPAITDRDLLIIASGSGSTGTLVSIAGKCKKIGAGLALITTRPDSPIGSLADVIVKVETYTPKEECEKKSFQPGANTFEQSVLLIGDASLMDLIGNDNIEEKNRELMKMHANLE